MNACMPSLAHTMYAPSFMHMLSQNSFGAHTTALAQGCAADCSTEALDAVNRGTTDASHCTTPFGTVEFAVFARSCERMKRSELL